jgi:uncharacterized membrane protein
VAGVTIVDALCAQRLTGLSRVSMQITPEGTLRVRRRITVNRPADALYRFWRDFSNAPRFMERVDSVQTSGERRTHWRARGPAGVSLEWDAEVTEERPGELIAWRSVQGSKIDHSGRVRFTPAPREQGTEVRVELRYDPPGGALGAALAKLTGEEPRQQVKDDLRRFKQVMETGEVVRSEATPEGQTARRLLKQRPARPPEGDVVKAADRQIERSYA